MESLTFVWMLLTLALDTAAEGGYECPRVTYKQSNYGFIYKVRSYIHCEHGCCGYRGDYCCTPSLTTTERPTYNDNVSLYLGVISGTIVAIVCIISITCCVLSKYNKKNVTVGADPSRVDVRRPHVLTVQDLENRTMSPPPAYEHAVTASAPPYTSVRYTRSSGKVFTSR